MKDKDYLPSLFGEEHHEARAERFVDQVVATKKNYTDLEIAVFNMTKGILDMGSELAADLEGNEELAQWIRDDDKRLEMESAEATVISVYIAGDDRFRIADALGTFDSLAAKEKGTRWPKTGQIREHGLKKVPIPLAVRENLPGKECLALYEFRNLTSNS